MADHEDADDHGDVGDHGDEHGDVDDHGEDHADEPQKEWGPRATAPQSPYTGRDVGVGAVIALIGALITFGVPLLLL